MSRRRFAIGSENCNAKLDEDAVEFIRRNYRPRDEYHNMRAYARQYEVSHETIRHILMGWTWKHVEPKRSPYYSGSRLKS